MVVEKLDNWESVDMYYGPMGIVRDVHHNVNIQIPYSNARPSRQKKLQSIKADA